MPLGSSVGAFAVRLVVAILALVLFLLGVIYTLIGVVGDQDDFATIGPPFLAAGLAFAGVYFVLRGRARAAAERDRVAMSARTRATVVKVELHPYIRIGTLITITLTVDFGAGRHSRRVSVSPFLRLEPGGEIEIVYDPADPASFLPVDPALA